LTRDPRFDILFEPVKIGPVVTNNRFYQSPPLQWDGLRQAPSPRRDARCESRRWLGSRIDLVHPGMMNASISILARSPWRPAMWQIRRVTPLRRLAA
jgi:hypothetical protein